MTISNKSIKSEEASPNPEYLIKSIAEQGYSLETSLADLMDNSISAKADKIDEALPMVKDLSLNDQEMDEIATTAKDTFQDLMDLGMNVESRYAGEIFNTAARLLDTALNAKGAKVDRKLKMIQLQLQKARLDQVQAKHDKESGVQEEGDAVILDRNALLEKLLSKDK